MALAPMPTRTDAHTSPRPVARAAHYVRRAAAQDARTASATWASQLLSAPFAAIIPARAAVGVKLSLWRRTTYARTAAAEIVHKASA